jgi:hypothetical protein
VADIEPEESGFAWAEAIAPAFTENYNSGAIEKRIQAAPGLRIMFRRAAAMLEIADYAERSDAVGAKELLPSLRRDAMAIRIATLKRLAGLA